MASFSKFLSNPKNPAFLTGCGVALYLAYRKLSASNRERYAEIPVVVASNTSVTKELAAVDSTFFRRLWKLLKILVPRFFSLEGWYLMMIASLLVARTLCDVWMMQNGTLIESVIINRDPAGFRKQLLAFIYAMPIISSVNNALKYGMNMLKLRFRINLSTHLYNKYLKGFTYYQMSNLDNRIANPDHLITQDVEKFCNSVADLYTNLSKPMLDVILYSVRLATFIGPQGPGVMLLYLTITGLILTRLRRPIARMTVKEQKLEGEYRYVNSRIITNGEEVAFYQGNEKEHGVIMSSFRKLIKHLTEFIFFRMQMGMVDDIVAKYLATVVGYIVVSRPFFDPSNPKLLNSTHTQRLLEYYLSGRMLLKLAQAIGRIVLAGREMTRLSGFTSRVSQFITVLDDLHLGHYERTMVNNGQKGAGAEMEEHQKTSLKPGSGQIMIQDYVIEFDKVPLVTPNGDILIKELSFKVSSGVNVLVCGPNGCGKSSLFRTLGELWPLFGGKMTKPEKGKLFYVPQRPYMTVGTLRDQIIYPHGSIEQIKKGVKDSHLEDILKKVQLGYILDREEGWEAVQDWMDVLSGGEKQRVAMARLFYHQPQFAILDECTSAVSVDVEGYIYQHCREVGITLFTVSHRKSLWKHHKYYLMMDGRGSYKFQPITDETSEFGS